MSLLKKAQAVIPKNAQTKSYCEVIVGFTVIMCLCHSLLVLYVPTREENEAL
jgi:hypothetical protein